MTSEAPATSPLASATDEPATVSDLPAPAPRPAPGSATRGWEMFFAFVFAVLSITITVCVLTLVGSWWMLAVAVGVHIGITATMMWLVFGSFGSSEHQYPDIHTAEAASRAAIAAHAALSPSRPRLALHH